MGQENRVLVLAMKTLGLQDAVPRTNVQRFPEIRPFMLPRVPGICCLHREKYQQRSCSRGDWREMDCTAGIKPTLSLNAVGKVGVRGDKKGKQRRSQETELKYFRWRAVYSSPLSSKGVLHTLRYCCTQGNQV